jgi:hypothetical protein
MAKGYSDMKKESLDWLLEKEDSGIRYLALRGLAGAGDAEVIEARKQAHTAGPIATVLDHMSAEGYWEKPGPGYNPKYSGTVWSIILLAQLGASAGLDKRIATACNYLLSHTLTTTGQFTMNGLPSGTIDCLQGNLCWALWDLGCRDPRLEKAFEWMAKTVTGEGIAPMAEKDAPVRYYSGKCGPEFACGGNNKEPCAWGATKAMLAFSKLPADRRTPVIERAIKAGVNYLFSTDPAKADYPSGYSARPSGNWWKFGFPVFYVTDVLQIAAALALLGYGKDPRLANTIKLISDKQDKAGRWPLEYSYAGKTWGDYGELKKPNKWITLRALRVLKMAGL